MTALLIYAAFPLLVWLIDGSDQKELRRSMRGLFLWYAAALVFGFSLYAHQPVEQADTNPSGSPVIFSVL
jgi:hypothetical protein